MMVKNDTCLDQPSTEPKPKKSSVKLKRKQKSDEFMIILLTKHHTPFKCPFIVNSCFN